MEGRPVLQSVGLTEVQQREPIPEHHHVPSAVGHHLCEGLIQLRQLCQIRLQPPGVVLCVFRIGLLHRLGNGPAQPHGNTG